MRALLTCLLFVVACGPRTTAPETVPRTGSGSAQVATPKPSADGPTERECDELFGHAFAIVIADKQPPPADAEVAAHDVKAAFIADCRAGTRAYQQCGLAAKTQRELDACKR